MFRSSRKPEKQISEESMKLLLMESRRGLICVNGDGGYPYAVPVNYFYDEDAGKIYFHGSGTGHKADSIRKDGRVCFTVFGNERSVDSNWAPRLDSVVVFGKCKLLSSGEHSISRLRKIVEKYYPENLVEDVIAKSGKAAQMYEIQIEHMSGKSVQEK